MVDSVEGAVVALIIIVCGIVFGLAAFSIRRYLNSNRPKNRFVTSFPPIPQEEAPVVIAAPPAEPLESSKSPRMLTAGPASEPRLAEVVPPPPPPPPPKTRTPSPTPPEPAVVFVTQTITPPPLPRPASPCDSLDEPIIITAPLRPRIVMQQPSLTALQIIRERCRGVLAPIPLFHPRSALTPHLPPVATPCYLKPHNTISSLTADETLQTLVFLTTFSIPFEKLYRVRMTTDEAETGPEFPAAIVLRTTDDATLVVCVDDPMDAKTWMEWFSFRLHGVVHYTANMVM